MKSYPIWHEVSACHYQSSKSYGGMRNSIDKISVGNGVRNSVEMATTCTTKREYFSNTYNINVVEFRFSVDDIFIKKIIFDTDKKGRPKNVISTINNLERKTG